LQFNAANSCKWLPRHTINASLKVVLRVEQQNNPETTVMNKIRPVEILLVDDNEDDVELTRYAFEQAKLANNVHHVANGELALKYLRREEPYTDVPAVDLVLLDINMPVMDGRETMQHIAADESLKGIPVVVLTTSQREEDIAELYKLRCSSYVTKPVGFESMAKIAQELTGYWFQLVKLP